MDDYPTDTCNDLQLMLRRMPDLIAVAIILPTRYKIPA